MSTWLVLTCWLSVVRSELASRIGLEEHLVRSSELVSGGPLRDFSSRLFAPAPYTPNNNRSLLVGDCELGNGRDCQPLLYVNGFPIIERPTVYLVWFGDWSNAASVQNLTQHVFENLGGSSYLSILSDFKWAKTNPSGNFTLGKSTSMPREDITYATLINRVGRDPSGIYMILFDESYGGCTSKASVIDSGFTIIEIFYGGCTFDILGGDYNQKTTAFLYLMMSGFIDGNTWGYQSFTSVMSRICSAPTAPNVVLAGKRFTFPRLVTLRPNGQFCASSKSCSSDLTGYECLSRNDHPGDVLATRPWIQQLDQLAAECSSNANCMAFTNTKELKTSFLPLKVSSTVDIYVKKCKCFTCGYAEQIYEDRICLPANARCGNGVGYAQTRSCYSEYELTVAPDEECLCTDHEDVHGLTCQDAIPLVSGQRVVTANVKSARMPGSPMNVSCLPVGYTVFFNLSTTAGSTCVIDTCDSASAFDTVLAVYDSCKAKSFVACNNDAASGNGTVCGYPVGTSGLSSLTFVATQDWYVIGVGIPTRLPSQAQLAIRANCTTNVTKAPSQVSPARPTKLPSFPTKILTRVPTTKKPTKPTKAPTSRPTRNPSTTRPSRLPTVQPTRKPTR